MNIAIIALVFGVMFIAELPDKSMFASLALTTRYRKLYVWMGAATAFLAHVIIAVTAGQFLTLLPQRIVELVVAALFAFGAALLFFGHNESDAQDLVAVQAARHSQSFRKSFTASFVLVFIGEWGDVTQIATANYAAKYHDPLSVGLGAILGLWTVAAFGIIVGTKVLERIPAATVKRVTAAILLIFAIISLVAALKP